MNLKFLLVFSLSLVASTELFAWGIRGLDVNIPGDIYRELEFSDRAAVDRAQKVFNEAIQADGWNAKAQDIIPRYRAARSEWKKVQILAEGGDYNQELLAWAQFMQGYCCYLSRDRNEASKLLADVMDMYSDDKFVYWRTLIVAAYNKRAMGDNKEATELFDIYLEDPKREATYFGVLIKYERGRWMADQKKDKKKVAQGEAMLAEILEEKPKYAQEIVGWINDYLNEKRLNECRWEDLEKMYVGKLTPADKDKYWNAKVAFLKRVMGKMKRAEIEKRIAEIPKKLTKLWLREELDERDGNWKAVMLDLDMIDAEDPEYAKSNGAKYKRLWIVRDRLQEYDAALKLVVEIDDPPKSLWELQTTQRRAGKRKEAYATLVEIASMFPNEAAAAVWTTAEYRRQDGEKQKAIGLYKQLLTHPEWKKSPHSSQAHQRLEDYGIATGGAMINTVR